jgi:hypothetical protein
MTQGLDTIHHTDLPAYFTLPLTPTLPSLNTMPHPDLPPYLNLPWVMEHNEVSRFVYAGEIADAKLKKDVTNKSHSSDNDLLIPYVQIKLLPEPTL